MKPGAGRTGWKGDREQNRECANQGMTEKGEDMMRKTLGIWSTQRWGDKRTKQ